MEIQKWVLDVLGRDGLIDWGVLSNEVLYWYMLFCCLFLVIGPCYPWFLYKTGYICTYILDPHPDNTVYLFTIYLYPLLLTHSSSHEEVCQTVMAFKLDLYLWVDSMMNIDASFFLNFSGCTSLWGLMLIPLPFWESILTPDLNNKHFSLFSIKYDGTTYRFILL